MKQLTSILQTYHLQTGECHVLREFDSHIEAPNWSVDGSYLVYNSGGLLYRYDLQTGVSLPIPTGRCTSCNNDHVLSADGKQIAISSGTGGGWLSRIYTLPITGGEPREVTPQAPSYLHGWSPDGSTLAYCAQRDGVFDIYTIPAAGGRETRLTDAPGLNDGPEYSPDGKHIWFNSVRTGLMQAWRMNADGSGQTQMTFDAALNTWFPHISPDNQRVVMLSYHKDDVDPGDHPANKNILIRLMNSDGTGLTTLLEAFGGQGTLNVNSWAPDSSAFAFVTYRLE